MKRKIFIVLLILILLTVGIFLCFHFGLIKLKNGAFVYTISPLTATVEIVDYTGDEENVVIPKEILGMQVVSVSGFNIKRNLVSVKVPEGVRTIKDGFTYCKMLKIIDLPDSLETIKGESFYALSSLKKVTVPKNVVEINTETIIKYDEDNWTFWKFPFDMCENLESINVDTDNKTFMSSQGVLYNIKDKCVVKCPQAKKGEIVMPEWVTTVPYLDTYVSPFAYCNKITSVTLSKNFNMKQIVDNAYKNYNDYIVDNSLFVGCQKLRQVNVAKNNSFLLEKKGSIYTKNRNYIVFWSNSMYLYDKPDEWIYDKDSILIKDRNVMY